MFHITAITLKQIRAEKFVKTRTAGNYKEFYDLQRQLEKDINGLNGVKLFMEMTDIVNLPCPTFPDAEKILHTMFHDHNCKSRKITSKHYTISTDYATFHIEQINEAAISISIKEGQRYKCNLRKDIILDIIAINGDVVTVNFDNTVHNSINTTTVKQMTSDIQNGQYTLIV